MSKQTINVGAAANDGTGDTLRAASQKINANFTEVYNTSESAFDKANTASDAVNNLIPEVQSAWNTANAAYNAANTGGGGASLGNFKIENNYIGTTDDPDTGGWGGYYMNIDPNGEGWSGIQIPSLTAQEAGAPLTIYNNNVPESMINLNTQGGVQIASSRGTLDLGTDMEAPGAPSHFHIAFNNSNNVIPGSDLFLGDDYNYIRIVNNAQGVFISANDRTGGSQQEWRFNTNGTLTFPDGSSQSKASNYKKILTVTTPGLTYLDETDEIVFCDVNAAGDNINIYLPTSPVIGQVITVKNINTDGNVAYVQCEVGQYFETLNHSIDNGGYETLPLTSHAATWVWDGSTWRIINYYTG